MDASRYRRASQEVWERMAAGWDRRRQWVWEASRAVGEQMVARLDPQPGQTILELAAGTGETGFAAAARLGNEGRLISTDFSAPMVAAARRRAAELGLSNVEFRELDAEHMDLPDDSVDGVLCRWAYMLMADPGAALAETRRVLRRGGRLALSTWGSPEQNPWAALPRATLVTEGLMPPPEPLAPGIFAISTEQRVRELLGASGFEQVQVEPVPSEWRFEDFESYWQFLRELAGAIAVVLDRLSADQEAKVRATLEQKAAPFRSNDQYVMGGISLNAVAS